MASFSSVFIVLVFLCSLSFGQVALLVSKRTVQEEIVAGREIAVNIRIFNIGDSAAYDVHLVDYVWPAPHFGDSIGSNTAYFKHLAAGDNISHTYFVKAKSVGTVDIHPARVSYRENPLGVESIVYSNELLQREIRRFSAKERIESGFFFEWSVFIFFAGLPVVIPFLTWKNFTDNFENGLQKGDKFHSAITNKKLKRK